MRAGGAIPASASGSGAMIMAPFWYVYQTLLADCTVSGYDTPVGQYRTVSTDYETGHGLSYSHVQTAPARASANSTVFYKGGHFARTTTSLGYISGAIKISHTGKPAILLAHPLAVARPSGTEQASGTDS